MNLNKIYIIGRMVADPEFRTTPNGQEVVTLRIATNRVYTNQSGQRQENTEYHNVVAWGRLAQIANQYLKKGGLVMIEGRLQTRSWEGQDGVKRYKTEIITQSLQLGPRAADSTRPSENPRAAETAITREKTSASGGEVKAETTVKEDIPIVNEEEPPKEEPPKKEEVEETTVNMKDVPF